MAIHAQFLCKSVSALEFGTVVKSFSRPSWSVRRQSHKVVHLGSSLLILVRRPCESPRSGRHIVAQGVSPGSKDLWEIQAHGVGDTGENCAKIPVVRVDALECRALWFD